MNKFVDMETRGQKETPRLFLIRATCCVLVPPSLTAYYLWTYLRFLHSKDDFVATTDAPDGTLIWWSWFVIGALGLNISSYVLGGVEAGMFTKQRSNIQSVDKLQLHQGKSWGSISGSWRALTSIHRCRPSWIWVVLWALSVSSWAFVLSGLTMETEDSFKPGSHADLIDVVGVNSTTLDDRFPSTVLEAAYQGWRNGQDAHLPLVGALYTTPENPLDQFNMTTGNRLPLNAETPIFFSPQAEVPVTGTAWGLAVQYDCRPIHKLQDFQVLSRRHNSSSPGYLNGTQFRPMVNNNSVQWPYIPLHYFYDVPGDDHATISVVREFSADVNRYSIEVVAEVGLSAGIHDITDEKTRSYKRPYRGLEQSEVLEVAIWQGQWFQRDERVPDPIPGLSDEYVFWVIDAATMNLIQVPMDALGVQCVSTSATGTAELDGIVGAFRQFLREQEDVSYAQNMPRLSLAVPAMFLPGVRGTMFMSKPLRVAPLRNFVADLPRAIDVEYQNVITNDTEVQAAANFVVPLFTAGHVPMALRTTGDDIPYTRYATTGELVLALQHAFHHVAVQLMYNQQDNLYQAWRHQSLIGSVPWKVLVRPDLSVPPELVLAALVLWAVGCAGLGVSYSFRKRWESEFGSASLYQYCQGTNGRVDPADVMRK